MKNSQKSYNIEGWYPNSAYFISQLGV